MIVRQQPRHSALVRETDPDAYHWGTVEMLLAEIADAEHLALWQRGNGKRSERPDPIPRPGYRPEDLGAAKVLKGDILPLDEMREWLGWNETTWGGD